MERCTLRINLNRLLCFYLCLISRLGTCRKRRPQQLYTAWLRIESSPAQSHSAKTGVIFVSSSSSFYTCPHPPPSPLFSSSLALLRPPPSSLSPSLPPSFLPLPTLLLSFKEFSVETVSEHK